MASVVFDYNLKSDYPQRLLTEDLELIFEALDISLKDQFKDIQDFANLWNPDTMPEELLDVYLLSRGFRLAVDFPGITLSVREKRKLAKLAVPIFQQKGTAAGIINMIRLLLGLEAAVIQQTNVDAWKLDVSELGFDTFLGPDPSTAQFYIYGFEIILNTEPTQDEIDKITALANYMKPIHTHLLGVLGPPVPFDHWEIPFSELGINTDLHGS